MKVNYESESIWILGIHGNEEAVYSICLNGGYEGDIDMGDRLCFVGSGGRDLRGTSSKPKVSLSFHLTCSSVTVQSSSTLRAKFVLLSSETFENLRTAPQSCDMRLHGKNLGLYNMIKLAKPVRVLRGYKLGSQYAPDYGFRYDGKRPFCLRSSNSTSLLLAVYSALHLLIPELWKLKKLSTVLSAYVDEYYTHMVY